ncbi:MAG: hypothetical protein RML72_04960 [Bacteroidia bacterium]|nr:hypothetical protein [Bacteroidia bacterium]MDW8158213.1 hypothetical protein [Bacteroidia bacterium]
MQDCSHLIPPFNSDGNFYYRAQLFPNEQAKLKYTFLTGITYRIIPCGRSDKNEPLSINIFDKAGLRVFTSKDVTTNNGYYDIEFGIAGQYTIAASFESGSGCASIIVAYLSNDKVGNISKNVINK